MILLRGRSISELYPALLELALEEGETVAPRGLPTLEVSPLAFELTDPRQCLVLQKARQLNYAYAIVERLSLLSGHSDPDMLCFYIGKLRDYVNPCTGCFDGAYGPRVRPQLEHVYHELSRDPASRRAVISVYSPSDQHESLDVPCTLTMHFLVRRGQLDLIVNMRSSDLFLGLPYDVSQFGFLQQVVAGWLDVGLGTYTHFASSAHVYSEHADKATQVALGASDVIEATAVAPRIAFRETFTQAELWFDLERRARTERLSPEAIAGLPETQRLAPELRAALFQVAAFSTRKLGSAPPEPATAGHGMQA